MGEGFIVRRGGGGQQTVKPIFNSLTSVTFTSLTLSVTNDSNSIATLYYSVVNTEPAPNQAGTFDTEFQGKETKDITITGLTSGTTYSVYIKAIAVGEFPSETVIVLNLTTGQTITATGGTTQEYDSGGSRFKSHTFTGNGTFEVTQLSNMGSTYNQVDVLIVAGGGGGGSNHGGGGGAGGMIVSTQTASQTSYSVTIGNGGTGRSGIETSYSGSDLNFSGVVGGQGGNSSVFGLTALGGGGGAGYEVTRGQPGGSGGGAQTWVNAGTSPSYPAGTPSDRAGAPTQPTSASGGFGNFGIRGTNSSLYDQGGAGGGAGGVGVGFRLMSGGPGLGNSFRTGSEIFYAGGGGAGAYWGTLTSSGGGGAPNGVRPSGGVGGGGAGGYGAGEHTTGGGVRSGVNGTANTGGGGGGSANRVSSTVSGAGGSGIVVIRYEIAPN